MANMHYCRFQNTLSDLKECMASLEEGEVLSREELRAANELLRMCEEISDAGFEPEEAKRCESCKGEMEKDDEDGEWFCPDCVEEEKEAVKS